MPGAPPGGRPREGMELGSATIVWFRQDLRLEDNPALSSAATRGGAVIPVYIWAPEEEGKWAPGAASRWWLHHSLSALDASLRPPGSRLVLRRGESLAVLEDLAAECGASVVCWNRRYEPAAVARDRRVEAGLRDRGLLAESFNSALLFEPSALLNRAGKPFQVFTPFWRACLRLPQPSPPRTSPRSLPPPGRWPGSIPLEALELEPKIDWAAGLRKAWTPGEEGAAARLRRFLRAGVAGYPDSRDRPDLPGTSGLSPHLHFGEIGPRRIWHSLQDRESRKSPGCSPRGAESFLRQLGWREFAHHLLFHFPGTAEHPLRPEFTRFPWARAPKELAAWRRGRTGYPLVDAGMRELWTTGWMHNRVRMITASFLVKDLRVNWLEGARWFWDTLVDADLANNTLGWQWAAGCGADAAPYFRIFNPALQGRKFDPGGDYVRKWIPELSDLPGAWIHEPHRAPAEALARAEVEPGKSYPRPVVDHSAARERALAALATLRKRR